MLEPLFHLAPIRPRTLDKEIHQNRCTQNSSSTHSVNANFKQCPQEQPSRLLNTYQCSRLPEPSARTRTCQEQTTTTHGNKSLPIKLTPDHNPEHSSRFHLPVLASSTTISAHQSSSSSNSRTGTADLNAPPASGAPTDFTQKGVAEALGPAGPPGRHIGFLMSILIFLFVSNTNYYFW